jgi:6-phosphogluconolactonase
MRSITAWIGSLLASLLLGAFYIVTPRLIAADGFDPARDTLAYVGTYTSGKSKGIHLFRLQLQNEDVAQNVVLRPLGLAVETPNPSFLEFDPTRRLVFAVNEVDFFEGKPTGAVSAFAIDPATGKLTLLNQRASGGAGPCHLALDKSGRNLLVANYGGGTVAVLPVAADGRLGDATSIVQHTGKSVNPERQEGPHAHGVTLDAANRFAFVCDLGLDKVMVYRFDAAQGKLTPHDPAFVALKPGAGPRHMTFRPDGKFAYVFNELHSTITVLAYDPAAGRLTEVETVSSLPPWYDGKNTGAEIAVLPSGKFLYASNRGNDTLVLFAIDAAKGTLNFIEEQTTSGQKPRHFGVQSSGRHLAIANQGTDNVLVCRIDAENGRLKPSGETTPVPSPVCVIFVPPAESAR